MRTNMKKTLVLLLFLFASNCFAQFIPQFNRQPEVGYQINLAHPDAQGLVGYWSFNEGLGLSAYDLSSFGNDGNGTLTNMDEADWVSGRDGWALDFDGSGDYVNIPDEVLNPTEGTVSLWVNVHTTSGTIFCFGNVNSGGGDRLYITNNGSGIFQLRLDNESAAGDVTATVGVWYNLVAVWRTDNTGEFFVDGVSNVTFSGLTFSSSIANGVSIGSQNEGSLNWNGLINNVRVYNRALSSEEVINAYINEYAMFEQPPGRILAAAAPPSGFSPGRLPQIIKNNNEKKNILERLSVNDSLYVSLD